MEKEKADKIISEYLPKIYGFAYKKSFSYSEAEEIASEITLEAYKALLSRDEILNPDGYIWRISEHTYAKYVSSVRKQQGISIDAIPDIPFYDAFDSFGDEEEKQRLRMEIAYLSAQRRSIIFLFYYKGETVKSISEKMRLPEGTVKWHLNKARNELKEGLKMERKIGTLGINPVKATGFGHGGFVGSKCGPEYYLGDTLNLNIVYSVYFEPKNITEIAEELGVTLPFIEDKVEILENNGYLVKDKNGKYTTYVYFKPATYSNEQIDNQLKRAYEAAEYLVKEYVPLVKKAMSDYTDIYIPGDNRQLFYAAAIFFAIADCYSLRRKKAYIEVEKYKIKDLDGGNYIAYVDLESECADPDYKMKFSEDDYVSCGSMTRCSVKYPDVFSWSVDTKLDSREGKWKNNLTSDYEYLYEYITGNLDNSVANSDKINRLKERRFIDENGKVQIMVCKGSYDDFIKRIPELDEKTAQMLADASLECAMQWAKSYPSQMQDLIIRQNSEHFDTTTAIMVLDILYENGTFAPLNEKERTTANLLMFSDVLPEK